MLCRTLLHKTFYRPCHVAIDMRKVGKLRKSRKNERVLGGGGGGGGAAPRWPGRCFAKRLTASLALFESPASMTGGV